MTKLNWLLTILISVILLGIFTLYPVEDDFYKYFYPIAQGNVTVGHNPYFTHWLLWPLSLLPIHTSYVVWISVTLAGFIGACLYFKSSPVPLLVSFPMAWALLSGNIDVLPLGGMVLGDCALRRKWPLVLGLSLVLMAVKPQLTIAIIALYLFHSSSLWQALVAPSIVACLSFWQWGLDWPLRWMTQRPELDHPNYGYFVTWPWGLLAFAPAILIAVDLAKRRKLLLEASAIGIPYFGAYSYILFFVQDAPWWAVIATWVPALAAALALPIGMNLATLLFVIPTLMLLKEIPIRKALLRLSSRLVHLFSAAWLPTDEPR